MVKKGTGKKDNKSSRFSFGSVIKYFKTSRGRMVFETGALLAFCTALLVSGGVSLAWYKVNTDVQANAGSVSIKNENIPEVTIEVYNVNGIVGDSFTFDSSSKTETLHAYDQYKLFTEIYKNAAVMKISFDSDTEKKVKLTLECSGGWTEDISNYLSNSVQIGKASVRENVAAVSNGWYSFVSADNIGNKDTSLTILDENADFTTESDLWLVFRYYEDVVEHIVNTIEDRAMDLNTGDIQFDSDISYSFEFM